MTAPAGPHDPMRRVRWVPLEVCEGLIEEAVRETMEEGGFLRGTVDAAVQTAREKAERLAADLHDDDGQGDVDGLVTTACSIECLHLPPRR